MKKVDNILVTAFAILTISATAVQAQSPVSVTVNGDAVVFTGQPPVSQDGRLLVPLRGVLEKIGATVIFSSTTKTIRAVKGTTDIRLTLGNPSATVNGNPITLDVPAQSVDGTTLVPLRFVAESLGADVKYDGLAQVVAIRTDGKPNVIGATQTPPATFTPAPSAGTETPKPQPAPETFTGVFLDFAQEPKDADTTVVLKMTDGRTLTLRKTAELTYQGQKIGFDDLRSGDKVVAIVRRNGRVNSATISDDE